MAFFKIAACCVWLQLSLEIITIAGMQMESQFEHCCGLGSNWAGAGLKCETFTGPVAGVATVEQGLCLSAVDICCVRSYHEKQCELGKSDARSGLACVGNNAPGGEYHRDCCEGCKLGILTGSMGQGCAFKKFAFGRPWDPAFLECCHEALPSTTEQVQGTSGSTNPDNLPTPELDDICELMKGQLCTDICIPSPGSYKCACREGFSLLEDGKTCRQDSPDSSKVDKTTPQGDQDDGGFRCPEGYRYQAATQVCDDIDECTEGTHNCGRQQCFNQPGTFQCARAPIPVSKTGSSTCQPGARYTRFGCEDINECVEIEDACTSNEECQNTPGSFVCTCKRGFVLDNVTRACVDINECQVQSHDCLPTQRCDNTMGSYTCVRFLNCGTGYTLNAASEICEDDDECVLGTHDCTNGYHCRNTAGSYRCERNSRYTVTTVSPRLRFYPLPSTTTRQPIVFRPPLAVPNVQITCPAGFVAFGNQCLDDDECARGQPCASTQRCINTVGSYACMPQVLCAPGYKLDSTEQRCVDIDECVDRLHECGPRQTCENRQGGYICNCPTGFIDGPNRDCVDIDECSIFKNTVCSTNSRCENTVGSYRCICEPGFESISDVSCKDVDECQQSPGICQHKCINAWGSYRCACNPGFRLNLDNRSCTDIDECMEFKENNLCIGICQNTPGSYSCQCPSGYRLGTDGRTCQDIDECESGQACRDPNEMCQNTRGNFRCNRIDCPAGYYRDTERKNRCLRTSRYCQTGDLACFQSPSHYSFNFMTFVSMLPIPQSGQLELFTMRGTGQFGSLVRFRMELIDVRAPPGVERATESCFALRRPAISQAVIVLTKSLQGPQEIELNLSMEIYNADLFAGSAVVKLFIFVSEYEF